MAPHGSPADTAHDQAGKLVIDPTAVVLGAPFELRQDRFTRIQIPERLMLAHVLFDLISRDMTIPLALIRGRVDIDLRGTELNHAGVERILEDIPDGLGIPPLPFWRWQ